MTGHKYKTRPVLPIDSSGYYVRVIPAVPVETYGPCRNAGVRDQNNKVRCRSWKTTLGDGLCLRCWDIRSTKSEGQE
jgi:hypothetical protein